MHYYNTIEVLPNLHLTTMPQYVKIIMRVSRTIAEAVASEESPSSIGQGCRITSGEGDFRESATENNRPARGKGGKVR